MLKDNFFFFFLTAIMLNTYFTISVFRIQNICNMFYYLYRSPQVTNNPKFYIHFFLHIKLLKHTSHVQNHRSQNKSLQSKLNIAVNIASKDTNLIHYKTQTSNFISDIVFPFQNKTYVICYMPINTHIH